MVDLWHFGRKQVSCADTSQLCYLWCLKRTRKTICMRMQMNCMRTKGRQNGCSNMRILLLSRTAGGNTHQAYCSFLSLLWMKERTVNKLKHFRYNYFLKYTSSLGLVSNNFSSIFIMSCNGVKRLLKRVRNTPTFILE